MSYERRVIVDREAIGDDIFIIEDLGNGKVRLRPEPTSVTEVGTPINAELLQPIENVAAYAVTEGRQIKTKLPLKGGGYLSSDLTLELPMVPVTGDNFKAFEIKPGGKGLLVYPITGTLGFVCHVSFTSPGQGSIEVSFDVYDEGSRVGGATETFTGDYGFGVIEAKVGGWRMGDVVEVSVSNGTLQYAEVWF